jgi:Holliday junction resolvasome RuvABC endonuclease subunit
VSDPRVIAALDPGLTNVGLGLVARYGAKLDLVESQHIHSPAAEKLDTPEAKRDDLNRRLKKIWRDIALVCRDYRPVLFGIEDQQGVRVGARMNAKRQIEAAREGRSIKSFGMSAEADYVAEVVGIVKAVAFSYGVPVMMYTAQQAKIAVCGRGHGHAEKREVIQAVRHYFPGIERDGHVLKEHEADAIAGAIYCERITMLQARRAG